MTVTYHLPDKYGGSGDVIRADKQLYNDLIDYIETTEARWARQSLSTGQQFTKVLSSVLWYLDPHHDTLHDRGCSSYSISEIL